MVWTLNFSPGGVQYEIGPQDITGDSTVAPALPGKNLTFTEPAFGATILQVTDATDGGTNNFHPYSAWSCLSRDNAYFVVKVNGAWKLYSFSSGPPMSATFVRNLLVSTTHDWEKSIWDFSGSNDHILYVVVQGTSEAHRLFKSYDADADTFTTIKDFASAIRTSGTISAATSSTVFASTDIVQPVSDYTPEYFTDMKLKFTSGALNGEEQVISAFVEATGAFTTAAFTAAPAVGDAFYVRPAGYNRSLDVSESARYMVCAMSKKNEGGQDLPGCLVAYDVTLDTLTARHVSSAEINTGLHQTSISKDQPYVNVSGLNNDQNIWNFSANTMGTMLTDSAHKDGGSTLWAQVDQGLLVLTTRPFSSPGDTATTIATFNTKSGKSRFSSSMHISWNNSDLSSVFMSSYYVLPTTNFALYSGTADVDALYKSASWVSGQRLALTSANQGFVMDTGVLLTNMGSDTSNAAAAALITGNGQWAYDTTNNDLFVRGSTAQDLTDTTTYRIVAADYRSQHDELVKFNFGTAGTTKYQRICRLYAHIRTTADEYYDAPKASVSYDSKYAVFTSTWGGRNRRDVFIAQIPQ